MRIVNKKKFIKAITGLIITLILIITTAWIAVDFILYPEEYLTTWRYQLKLDIENGEQEAIDYYQKTYLDNGKKLWD